MTTPDYQFVQLTDTPATDKCGLTLPVSVASDIKFQIVIDTEIISGELLITSFLGQSIWNVDAEFGTIIDVNATIATRMEGAEDKDVDEEFTLVKAETTNVDMKFSAQEYQEDGTVDAVAIDNLQFVITDTAPYYLDIAELDLTGQIPDINSIYDDMNDVVENPTDIEIPIDDYNDETIEISGNVITAKADCKVKFAGPIYIEGSVAWDLNLPDSGGNDWALQDFYISINATDVHINLANLATYNAYQDGHGFLVNDFVLNNEITLLEGETITLKYTLASNKTVGTYPLIDVNLVIDFDDLIITRTNTALEAENGVYFKVVMVDDQDEIIQVGAVDVINQTFKRTDLAVDDIYGISVPFDSTELINSVPTGKIKFKLYEVEKLYSGDVDHLIAYTTIIDYVKDATWLVQATRVYEGQPFWKYVEYQPATDLQISLHNVGSEDISIMYEGTDFTVEPDMYVIINYDAETTTWTVTEYTYLEYALYTGIIIQTVDASGQNVIQTLSNSLFEGVIDLTDETLTGLAINDCFRIKITNGTEIYYTNIFSYIGCETDNTLVISYYCYEDAMDFIAYSDRRRGVNVRLPLIIKNPQYPQNDSIYEKLNGDRVVLSSTIKEEKELETDYMPELYHKYLVIALGHDQITFDDIRMIKSDTYEIGEDYFDDSCENRYRKASAKLQYNITHRNANIGALGVES